MSAFKFNVTTDNVGTSNDDQFTLPLRPGYAYNCTITGAFTGSPLTQTTDVSPTLTFPGGAGTYELEITENVEAGFPTIYFNDGGDKLKYIETTQLGTNRWVTMRSSFNGCANHVISAIDASTAVTQYVEDFHNCFRNNYLTTAPDIRTDSATTTQGMFINGRFTTTPLYDLSNATDIDYMFALCINYSVAPLYDLHSCTTADHTFWGTALTEIPLYNLQNCIDMSSFLDSVTLTSESYTAFLIHLAATNTNTSVTFHGGNSKYYGIAIDDRAVLTSDRSWSITDGGQETETFGTLSVSPSGGPIGTEITISNTGTGFYDTMVIKDKDASGISFDEISVSDYNELMAKVPDGFIGPDIYVANPGSEVDTILDAFEADSINVPRGNSVIITDAIQDIDYWKIYRNLNGAGFVEISESSHDYKCPYVQVGDQRVYSFAYPYPVPNELSIGDRFILRLNPAWYDADKTEFIFYSEVYTVMVNEMSRNHLSIDISIRI